jgi:hypothetical protein
MDEEVARARRVNGVRILGQAAIPACFNVLPVSSSGQRWWFGGLFMDWAVKLSRSAVQRHLLLTCSAMLLLQAPSAAAPQNPAPGFTILEKQRTAQNEYITVRRSGAEWTLDEAEFKHPTDQR